MKIKSVSPADDEEDPDDLTWGLHDKPAEHVVSGAVEEAVAVRGTRQGLEGSGTGGC